MSVPQQSSPRVVIGLDGGGTKTIACVVDTKTRTQLSSCKTLSSNKYSVGETKAKNEIFNAMNGALKEANLNLSNVDGISLGMSGVDRPEDKELVRRWMEEFVGEYKHIKIKVNSDTFTSISSGTLGVLHGMVIIAGTGSIVVATDGGESQVRAGGWGPLLGDVGSGWAIGHDVLCAVARAVDGTGPDTMLTQAVKEELKLNRMQELIRWTYQDLEWSRIASVAQVCLKCAEKGDKVALEILHNNVKGLLHCAKVVAEKMKWKDNKFTLVLVGSLLTSEGSKMLEIMKPELQKMFPKAEITFPKVSPEMGAALLVLPQKN